MSKSKLRMEQEAKMDSYPHRYPAALRRYLRKVGKGNASEGFRVIAEQHMQGFVERRGGPADRRTKKK